MNRSKRFTIGIAIVVLLVLGAIFVGAFPVARVNGSTIWYHKYQNNADALQQYHEKSQKAATDKSLTPEEVSEVRRQVLQNIIANIIVEKYITAHYSLKDLQKEADEVTNQAMKSETVNQELLPKATQELYGWSVEEYKKQVLMPTALQQVLEEHVQKDGKNFAEIMSTELKNAKVSLMFVPWEWQEGQLVKK
jgi:uncharacterized protein (DUF885 family)